MDRDLHFRCSFGRPECAYQLIEMDRGYGQAIAVWLARQAWEIYGQLHDGKSNVAPYITGNCDREATILHLLSKSYLVGPNDCPEILEAEDRHGLVIDLAVGTEKGDLISPCVRPPRFTSNASNGSFISVKKAKISSSLTKGSASVIGIRYICRDFSREQNKPVYLVANLSGKSQKWKGIRRDLKIL